MTVAVDIGNTRTKVGIFENGTLMHVLSVSDVFAKDVQRLFVEKQIQDGIISTVSKSGDDWSNAFPSINWTVLNRKTPLPFKNDYDSPETLGLDRIALAAAATTITNAKNILVIDAGTCVTYDMITAEQVYLGGSISPGLAMRLRAMHHFTAKLPELVVENVNYLIGKSTKQSMQSGALNGLAAEIDGMITRYKQQFENLHTVLTGGDANLLAPLIKNNIFARPNFLLEGLHVIHAYNTP